MKAQALTPAIGAVVDMRLEPPFPADIATALRELLARFQVLFFRDQQLDLAGQLALTQAMGPLMRLPFVTPMEGQPNVIRVLKEADEGGGVFGGDWHSDFSFIERPPVGSILSAREVPPVGGDTLWASGAAAWDHLDAADKALIDGRDGFHVGKPYGVKWAPPVEERAGGSIRMSRGDPTADEERAHPAVLRNPVTGRASVYLNPTYVCRLDGMTEAESAPILARIQALATSPALTCRWRWQAGDIAIWDNLFTQHFAVNDYFGHRREMWRTTFAGPVPRELAA